MDDLTCMLLLSSQKKWDDLIEYGKRYELIAMLKYLREKYECSTDFDMASRE